TPGGDDPTTPPSPPGLAGTQVADAEHDVEALAQAAIERRWAADRLGGQVRVGLTSWFVLAVAGSLLAQWLQHPDAAVMLALAAVFALVQSWDVRDRAHEGALAGEPGLEPGAVGFALRVLVPFAVPVMAAIGYIGLGVYAKSLPFSPGHLAAMRWCWAAAA